MSLAGIQVTAALALNIAADIAHNKGKSLERGRGGKGHGWLYRFKGRYKELTEWGILEGTLKNSRDPVEEEKVQQEKEASKFVKKLECVLHKHGVNDDLDRIYNVDSVLSISDELSSSSPECVTATLCMCANGTYLPPMLTFATGLPHGEEFRKEGPPNALYNTSLSGQLDQVIFIEYIKYLEPFLTKKRPVFVLSAEKAELVTDLLMEFCLEKEIWLVNIPKNKVPHFAQPFDSIVPSLIATIERRATTETTVPVDRYKVPWLLKCALSELQEEQVKVSFKNTGFLPKSAEDAPDTEFAAEKCAACEVRIGISGVHCIICGCLYHEACAAKQKGDTTAICRFCLKA